MLYDKNKYSEMKLKQKKNKSFDDKVGWFLNFCVDVQNC